MFFSGFCDEAGTDLATQIKAQKAIGGYEFVELRMVDKVQFCAVDDDTFEKIWERLQQEGLGISCYGSAVANWSRDIDGDFQADLDDLKRVGPRMQKTGTKFIRVMSWANRNKVPYDEWHAEAVRRMRELAKIAEDNGIVLAHENCDGWAGDKPENSLQFIEEVGSSALKLIFDTGNPPGHGQDSLAFYKLVREHIAYVHIKDVKPGDDGKMAYCYPGEGVGDVKAVVTDLLQTGYDGGFSIEPHMAGAIHDGDLAGAKTSAFDIYVEYGKRLKALVESCKA